MVDSVEPKGESLYPVVGRSPERDREVDLPEGLGLFPWHDAVERCSSRPNVHLVNAHGVKCLPVHDIEATTSIHQHFSEPLRADDWVNDERAPSWLWDMLWVVGAVKSDGGVGPHEVSGHC
jgi:hypothetical protein